MWQKLHTAPAGIDTAEDLASSPACALPQRHQRADAIDERANAITLVANVRLRKNHGLDDCAGLIRP